MKTAAIEWTEIPGATPAIVSREMFEEAQKQLLELGKIPKRGKDSALTGHFKQFEGLLARKKFPEASEEIRLI